jgi:hypothetical protein
MSLPSDHIFENISFALLNSKNYKLLRRDIKNEHRSFLKQYKNGEIDTYAYFTEFCQNIFDRLASSYYQS